jgi:hypothetical protein
MQHLEGSGTAVLYIGRTVKLLCSVENVQHCCRVHLKCDGTRWRMGGEMKGKLANGVGSQYPSHYLRTWCIQHYHRWCAHLGCQESVNWLSGRFKWSCLFRWKMKSRFCVCAITFQTQSTTNIMFTIGSEDVLKHGVDISAMKSKNNELTWEIREMRKESTWETWREKTARENWA